MMVMMVGDEKGAGVTLWTWRTRFFWKWGNGCIGQSLL